MKLRLLVVMSIFMLAVGLLALAGWRRHAAVAEASTGPTIAVGTPSFSSGLVRVPINASGSGFAPYIDFRIHLRWNATLFALSGATSAGGPFDLAGGQAFCNLLPDGDGSGALFECTYQGSTSTTASGLLATFSLAPLQTGCSTLHLLTPGPPDNASLNGTSTTDVTSVAQTNTLVDGSTTAAGAVCIPGTPTPGTQLATRTPTATPTPPGPTPVNSAVGPVISVGTPFFVSGLIHVPVLLSGTGFNSYTGYQIHLTWNPAAFSFSSVNTVGALLDSTTNGVLCIPTDLGPGSYEIGCVGNLQQVFATGGLAATFILTPLQNGCSSLHLFTLGPPDGPTGATGQFTGTFTISTLSMTQQNQLIDGIACYPPPPATPTPASVGGTGFLEVGGRGNDLSTGPASRRSMLPFVFFGAAVLMLLLFGGWYRQRRASRR